MERFAMNEFQPLTLMEKKQRIQAQVTDIENQRQPLIVRKKEIELELSKYNNKIRKGDFTQTEYVEICNLQEVLKAEKHDVERKLSELKQQSRVKHTEESSVHLQLKRIPDEKAKETMLELRDKYLAFAADTTRVSSMRAMASRFVEEIQSVLKDMP